MCGDYTEISNCVGGSLPVLNRVLVKTNGYKLIEPGV